MGRKRLYFSEEHGAGAAVANGAEDRHFVGALARGLEVLACFRKGETMLGNQEIASRCKLPKSTVSRLTYTLTKLGYLHYIESVAKYRLGTAVLALGTTMLARLDVRNFAKPLMEELAATTRASVALGTRDRLSMVYVECVRGPSAISLNIDVGSRISISTSAMGRAFLAASTEEERAPIYEEMRALDSVKWPRTREMIAKSLIDHQTLGCTRSFGEWHEFGQCHRGGFPPRWWIAADGHQLQWSINGDRSGVPDGRGPPAPDRGLPPARRQHGHARTAILQFQQARTRPGPADCPADGGGDLKRWTINRNWKRRSAICLGTDALERRISIRNRSAAPALCLSIGFARKPLRTFRSDALAIVDDQRRGDLAVLSPHAARRGRERRAANGGKHGLVDGGIAA